MLFLNVELPLALVVKANPDIKVQGQRKTRLLCFQRFDLLIKGLFRARAKCIRLKLNLSQT